MSSVASVMSDPKTFFKQRTGNKPHGDLDFTSPKTKPEGKPAKHVRPRMNDDPETVNKTINLKM